MINKLAIIIGKTGTLFLQKLENFPRCLTPYLIFSIIGWKMTVNGEDKVRKERLIRSDRLCWPSVALIFIMAHAPNPLR
jgi:hypothetical protein